MPLVSIPLKTAEPPEELGRLEDSALLLQEDGLEGMSSQGLDHAESRSLGGSPPHASHADLTQAAAPQPPSAATAAGGGRDAGSGRGGAGGTAAETLAGAARAVAAGIGGIVGGVVGAQDGGEGTETAQKPCSGPGESSGSDGAAAGGPGATVGEQPRLVSKLPAAWTPQYRSEHKLCTS